MFNKSRVWLVVPLCLLLVAGCFGKSKTTQARVSGKVTYNGKTIKGGSITFHPQGGGAPYPLSIDVDGNYTGTELPTGAMKVAIETESVKASNKPVVYGDRGRKQEMSPVQQKSEDVKDVEYVKIPQKYADPESSGLTFELKAGRNSKDWDLTD